MAATLTDLLAHCRSESALEPTNYFDPRERSGDPDGRAAYRQDRAAIAADRRRCFKAFPGRLNRGTEELIPGTYGRLTISETGKIRYIPGQQAATEIYDALYDYLEATNNI